MQLGALLYRHRRLESKVCPSSGLSGKPGLEIGFQMQNPFLPLSTYSPKLFHHLPHCSRHLYCNQEIKYLTV